jgi:hypothetical protein
VGGEKKYIHSSKKSREWFSEANKYHLLYKCELLKIFYLGYVTGLCAANGNVFYIN